jgi:foldase protein PrsA
VKRFIGGALVVALAGAGGCGGGASSSPAPEAAQPVATTPAPVASSDAPAPAPSSPTVKSDASQVRQPMAEEVKPVVPVKAEAGRRPVAAAEMGNDWVVARVNGKPIMMSELQKPLVEAYGLKILLHQIQLNLAKQNAEKQHVAVTQADYEAELERTMKAGFQEAPKEDYPALLEQLLEKKGVSRAEFDMVVQTNAVLRKIAEPQLKDKITDEKVKEAFNAIYGESVVVRHIQCANPQEADQVRRRLAAGEKFEDLVRTMSRNKRTAALEGELPRFSRQTESWGEEWGKVPQGFKDWAFSAKEGDVSDPIATGDGFHIVKLMKRIEPRIVKYDDVKANIKANLEERLIEEGVKDLRGKLGQMAVNQMKIEDPTLRAQFEAKAKAAADQAKAAEAEKKVRQDVQSKTRPDTRPSPLGAPAAGDVAPAANASSGERPPATGSAAPAAPADTKAPDLNK